MTEYTRFGGLETLDQWVNWDPPTKRPKPSIKRPLPYETALANDPEHIGFVFTADDPYIGFDIDQTNPFTTELLTQLNAAGAFIQRSPSGQGWHAIGQGKLDGSGINWSRQGVEIYDSGRYFTMPMDNDVRGSVDADVQHIVDAVESEYRAQGPKASAVQLDRDIPEGERNHELFRIGSSLRGQHGFTEDVVLAALLGTNAMHCKPPLPEEEVVLIARSVGRYPAEVQGPQEQASIDDFEDEMPKVEDDWVTLAWTVGARAKPEEWMVEGLFERDQAVLIIAEESAGKTFLALDMAAHIAAGVPWMERETCGVPVLYFSGEGKRGIERRLAALAHAKPHLDGAPLYIRLDALTLTTRPEKQLRVGEDVERVSRAVERYQAGVVIIDTLSVNKGSAEENSNDDISFLIKSLRKALPHVTIIIVHHTTKDGESWRGASSLSNNTDLRFEVTVDEETRIRRFAWPRARDTATGALNFKLVPVTMPGFLTMVVEHVSEGEIVRMEVASFEADVEAVWEVLDDDRVQRVMEIATAAGLPAVTGRGSPRTKAALDYLVADGVAVSLNRGWRRA